jgi:hypothetical protein
MNHTEVLKIRAERIKAFREASGGGKSGVVPAGMAGFLLVVSRSRIKTLVASGRLETIAQGGQRWILFSSICKYAQDGQAAVSKSGMSKAAMTRPVMSRKGASNVGTI